MPTTRAVNAALLLLTGAGLGWGCKNQVAPPAPPWVARLKIVTADSALLIGHSLALRVAAWDSLGQPLTPASVRWRTAYPQWLPLDSTGVVRAALDNPGGDFPVYVSAPPSPVTDTLVLRVALPGEVKWRLWLGSMPAFGGPAQGPDGTLYVLGDAALATREATLFAVTSRGMMKWQRRLTQVDGSNYPVVGPDGGVYVVGQHVWAFGPDGALRWAVTTRPVEWVPNLPSAHAGALGADGTLYAAMGYDLFAFRASTGDTLWQGPRATDGGWLLPPSVSADGRTAYIKNTGDSLYAFGAGSGAIRWGVPDPSGRIGYGVGAAVAGSRLFVPAAVQLEEVDTTGIVMRVGPNVGSGVSEPAIGPDGILYVQFPQNYGVRAYRQVDQLLWQALGYRNRGWYGGPALAQGRVLYAAALDGMYALQLSDTGLTVRWRYPRAGTGNLIFLGAPLIGPDGTVYTFSSCDYGRETGPCTDELFAFWDDKPVEPNSPWPMWRHDARRSGQAEP